MNVQQILRSSKQIEKTIESFHGHSKWLREEAIAKLNTLTNWIICEKLVHRYHFKVEDVQINGDYPLVAEIKQLYGIHAMDVLRELVDKGVLKFDSFEIAGINL